MSGHFFTNKLSCIPKFGHVFIISGKISEDAKAFNINLAADEIPNDIPFHLSFRLTEKVLVKNSKLNGHFLDENENEHVSYGLNDVEFPFNAGEYFKVSILIGSDKFHVALNDIHYANYFFQESLENIKYLILSGGYELIKSADHRSLFPIIYPPILSNDLDNNSISLSNHYQTAKKTINDMYAMSNDIPIPYQSGRVILLTGNTLTNENGGFSIEILIANTNKSAFSFNVKFAQMKCVEIYHHSVEMGYALTMNQNNIQNEFPFEFNEPFKMAIGLDDTEFRISINGNYFCSYTYCVPIEKLSSLKFMETHGLKLNISKIEHLEYENIIDDVLNELSELKSTEEEIK